MDPVERVVRLFALMRVTFERMACLADVLLVKSALKSLMQSLSPGGALDAVWRLRVGAETDAAAAASVHEARLRHATLFELELLRLHQALTVTWPRLRFDAPAAHFVCVQSFSRQLTVNRALVVLWLHEVTRAAAAVAQSSSAPPSLPQAASSMARMRQLDALSKASTSRAAQLMQQQQQQLMQQTAMSVAVEPPTAPPRVTTAAAATVATVAVQTEARSLTPPAVAALPTLPTTASRARGGGGGGRGLAGSRRARMSSAAATVATVATVAAASNSDSSAASTLACDIDFSAFQRDGADGLHSVHSDSAQMDLFSLEAVSDEARSPALQAMARDFDDMMSGSIARDEYPDSEDFEI